MIDWFKALPLEVQAVVIVDAFFAAVWIFVFIQAFCGPRRP